MKKKSPKSRVAARSRKRSSARSPKRPSPTRTSSPPPPPAFPSPSSPPPPAPASTTPAPPAISRAAAAAAAFEPGPFSEPIPRSDWDAAGSTFATTSGAPLQHKINQGFETPYEHMRSGSPYPDPFPFEPPTKQEAAALNLSPAQRIALEHMLMGSQLRSAANAAGVTRMTLYRWLRDDPNFQAAYNTWQADAIINSRTRLLAMANTATSTVESAVQVNPRIALAVLKATGVLKRTAVGPTEPAECRREIELKQRKAQQQQTPEKQTPEHRLPAASASIGAVPPPPPALPESVPPQPTPDPAQPPPSTWEPAGASPGASPGPCPAADSPQYLGNTPPAATSQPVAV